MKIPRQGERRARFLAALNDMPRLETWTTGGRDELSESDAVSMYEAGVRAVAEPMGIESPRVRQHVKLIPRRVRRDMARQLSRRQYRADRGLPEPR